MTSPPGTKLSSAACVDGRVSFIINYDETTRALVDRTLPAPFKANPPTCVAILNTSTRRGELELIGANVDLSTLPGGIDHDHINIPIGETRISAAQLANVGFHVLEDVGQFGIGCGTDPAV